MFFRRWLKVGIIALLTTSIGISGYVWLLNAQASAQLETLRSVTQQLQTDSLRLTEEKSQLRIDLEVIKRQHAFDLTTTDEELQSGLASVSTVLGNVIKSQGEAIRTQMAKQKDALDTEVQSVRSDVTKNAIGLRQVNDTVDSISVETANLGLFELTLSDLSSKLSNLKVVDFNNVFLDMRASVFRIDTSEGSGTGWLIEPGLIVTAEHVISGFNSVIVRPAAGEAFVASVIGYDSRRDIALLRYDQNTVSLDSAAEPLSLGSISFSDIGNPLLAVGYSDQRGVKADGSVGAGGAKIGNVAQLINIGSGERPIISVLMNIRVYFGDSGGPVLDSEGSVVGIVNFMQGRSEYGLHVDEIRAVLPELKLGIKR
jgi:S1-C subfamily serine protease